MPLIVTHAFASIIPDDPLAVAAGEVVPSDWNAPHNIGGSLAASDLTNGTTGTGAIVLANAPTLTGSVALTGTLNGVTIDNTAYTSYSPTVTASSGTITTLFGQQGSYKRLGKTVFLWIFFGITTNGSGSGKILVSLPLAARTTPPGDSFTGTDINGFSLAILANGSTCSLTNYDGTYPGVSGHGYSINGIYETTA